MGRRKLDEHEKIARLNARKELKNTKNNTIQDADNVLLSEMKTEVDGVLSKLKRGRKAKTTEMNFDRPTEDDNITQYDNSLFSEKSQGSKNNISRLQDDKEPIDFFSMNVKNSTKKDKDNGVNISMAWFPNNETLVSKQKNNLPWIEKYRPSSVEDIILDDCLRVKLNNLISINSLPNLIITGSPGTGKTSTMFCLAKKILGSNYDEALLELNASDNRGLEIINNSIIHFCKKKINGILDGSADNLSSKKIIIFDEADNLTRKAQNVLANMMEEYCNTTKFCFTCNDSSKIIESIQSRCLILHYRPMNRLNIKNRLEVICKTENVKYDEKGLESIIFISQGDIRQAINNLEATHNSYNFISEDNVYKLCYQPHPNTIINLIQKCASRNLIQGIAKYEDLKDQGYCNSDILQTMINVLKLITIDEHIRINFIKILSDIYLNVSEGTDTNLQMYSCISKMITYMHTYKTAISNN